MAEPVEVFAEFCEVCGTVYVRRYAEKLGGGCDHCAVTGLRAPLLRPLAVDFATRRFIAPEPTRLAIQEKT